MATYIAIILWAACSLLVMIQYAPFCKELEKKDWLIVGCIFIIGGPVFVLGNILEALLDCYLPEGWDEDGPNNGRQ